MQECTIKEFIKCNGQIEFRRRLHGQLAEQWEVIIRRFNEIHVCDSSDVVYWGLTANKQFSTKSVYEFLEKDLVGPNNKLIWKAKIPLKIQYSSGRLLGMLFRLETI
jgi:hypothetical protein